MSFPESFGHLLSDCSGIDSVVVKEEEECFDIDFQQHDLLLPDHLQQWKRQEMRMKKGPVFSVEATLIIAGLQFHASNKRLPKVSRKNAQEVQTLYENSRERLQGYIIEKYGVEAEIHPWASVLKHFQIVPQNDSVPYLAKKITTLDNESVESVQALLIGENYPALVVAIQGASGSPYTTMKALLASPLMGHFACIKKSFSTLPRQYLAILPEDVPGSKVSVVRSGATAASAAQNELAHPRSSAFRK
jgi:hypothetical protein